MEKKKSHKRWGEILTSRWLWMFLRVTLICAVWFVVALFSPVYKIEANDEKTIDLSISPHTILFDIENFKPGDWAVREMTIINSGNEELEYIVTANLKEGSEKLYNALKVTIEDGKKNQMFNGTFSEFQNIQPRKLSQSESETLNITVQFPPELENDYQGLTSEVVFTFSANGNSEGILPSGDSILPNTATNNFNLLVLGLSLLVFSMLTHFLYRKAKK